MKKIPKEEKIARKKAYHRAYYLANKEKINKRNLQWYWNNLKKASMVMKEWRKKHKEEMNDYGRKYYRNHHKKFLEYNRKRLKIRLATEKGRQGRARTQKKMVRLYPEKYKSRTTLQRAVRSGKIQRPTICSICNKSGLRIHAHHEDYSKPLDVIWCCPLCHRALDDKKTERLTIYGQSGCRPSKRLQPDDHLFITVNKMTN